MANVSSTNITNGGYEATVTVTAGATQAILAALGAGPASTTGIAPGPTQLMGVLPGAVNVLTVVAAAGGLCLPLTYQPGVIFAVTNATATATTIYPPCPAVVNAVTGVTTFPPAGSITFLGAVGAAGAGQALPAAGAGSTHVYMSCGVRANGTGVPGTEFIRIV